MSRHALLKSKNLLLEQMVALQPQIVSTVKARIAEQFES